MLRRLNTFFECTKPYFFALILFLDLLRPLSTQNAANQAENQSLHRRFEYKHSFKTPRMTLPDGTVPFWTISGDAIAHSQQIRLAPSLTSKAGSAWNTKPMIESEYWTVNMSMKIMGRNRLGADGVAMWYTAAPSPAGPVFGSSELWVGLGIFFDSFDNDLNRDAPLIAAMFNNGSSDYDHAKDGGANIAAKCQRDFRNKPHPIKALIEYKNRALTVHIHNGNSDKENFELCFKVDNVFLPKNGYFGLSAATGGLADDHDVLSFEVYSLSPSRPQPPAVMPDEQQKQVQEDFMRQQEQFKREKEEYQKQHPDQAKFVDDKQQFVDPLERDILAIYESQSNMLTLLQEIGDKISTIFTKQDTLVQLAHQRAGHPAGAVPVASSGESGITRNEAFELVQASREMTQAVRDIKALSADIQNRVIVVDQRVSSGQAGSQKQPVVGSASQGDMDYQKNNIDVIRREVEQIRLHQKTQKLSCPSLETSCVTSTIFIFVIVAQSILFLLYALFSKRRNEKAKFY